MVQRPRNSGSIDVVPNTCNSLEYISECFYWHRLRVISLKEVLRYIESVEVSVLTLPSERKKMDVGVLKYSSESKSKKIKAKSLQIKELKSLCFKIK